MKSSGTDARLTLLNSTTPIRSRAAEEGGFQIPPWSVPLILLLLYVCLFSGLGALGLTGPDEPRYAAIARAMSETHDWITPKLWGVPWFEKPVLYYWSAGIAMRIFGVSEFAARLPSALAALLAIAAGAWTALRSYGVSTAWFTLLMLPTSVAIIGFSRAASSDMLFAGLLTAAMAVACEMLQTQRPGPASRIAFGFLLGAAVLAKGPAAVILAGGATLLWAALTREWHAPFRFLHPLIVAAFCATALPWYVVCSLRNPDFLRVFIWHHNFQRYLTPVFEHRQPFWFYAPILILATIPWIVMAASLLSEKWNKTSWEDSPGIFIFCWAVFPLLFFSFSQSKLPGYILPAVPPAFLLISRAAGRLLASDRRRFVVWIGITGAMFTTLAFAGEKSLGRLGDTFQVPRSHIIGLLALAAAGGLIAMGFSVAKKPTHAVVTAALLIAALLTFMNVAILPFADAGISARKAASDGLRLNPSGDHVAVFELNRDWHYELNYYFRRDLPEWMSGTPLPEWLFTTERDAAKFQAFGNRIHQVSTVGAPHAILLHVTAAQEDGAR